MSDQNDPDTAPSPLLRVLGGMPSAEELAVLTAVLGAAGGGHAPLALADRPGVRHGGWSDPARAVQSCFGFGVDGWRGSGLPR